MTHFSRRQLLKTGLLTPLVFSLSGVLPGFGQDAAKIEASLKGRLFKSLKIGMVQDGGSLAEKFAIAKAAGFEGIELDAPGFDITEVQKAIDESGLPVDGSVCASHWNVRHSDPDESVRKKALDDLLAALQVTHEVGGHTVLLVVGHGKDGSKHEVWERSVANIRQALPLASRLGVTIAFENVWNHFCYDHDGGADQSAEDFAKYVDAFDSPFIGMQFDIGNHWKYGNTGDWIRTLGQRIVKLDIKGFSRAEDKFTAIGEGDIDYADVRKSLIETNFHGWCAAEVGGGNADYLAGVSAEMDKAFGLR